MFLKSLTVKGFKSFADTTILEFEPGVTVVVGPNGSGKSNVVDAVAWVLGAQGPRMLRSGKMDDVIFAGTPKRPALGRAEVSLTIDNSSGLLPIDFSEVTITRTLFRSGESDYAINRVPCRLLDIQELLSDTGVGRQQHVIVSQGNIDAVLNARPEERRLVIEEAAGVLKYRRRKEKAERRLESTETSLVRLQDLLREVRRQLRPLEKQAEAARRYGDVVAELAAVRRHLLGRELAVVESRLSRAARDRHDQLAAEEQLRKVLTNFDVEIVEAEAHLERTLDGERAVDLAEMVSRAEGLRARAGGLVAVISERRRSLERLLRSTIDQDVIASLEAEAASLTERLADAEAEAVDLLPQAEALETEEADLAAESAAFELEWVSEPAQAADPAAEVRGELGGLRATLERAGGDVRRLQSRRAPLTEKVTRLQGERDRLGLSLEQAEGAEPELDAARQTAALDEAEAAEAVRDADEARTAAEADFHRWEARKEALAQALDEARAQAGIERLAGLSGIVGTLMELIEIDVGYESAFEAAAGEALAAVIVEGPESARQAIHTLRLLGEPGTVVALPIPGSVPLTDPRPRRPGAAPLRDRVAARLPAVSAFLDSLLANVVVADGDWHQAVDIALARADLIVVTPHGDRFSHGLWKAGVGRASATRAAADEAASKAAAASVRVASATDSWRAASQSAEAAREHRLTAARAHETNQLRRQTATDMASRVASELTDSTSELHSIDAQTDELQRRMERDQARMSELNAMLPELERLAAAGAARTAAERSARGRLAERTAAVASLRRELEVRAASLEERRLITSRRLEEVDERLRHNVAERDEASDRRVAAESTAVAAERLWHYARAWEVDLDALVSRLREARLLESETTRELSNRLETLRRQRSTAERQLGELRERAARIDLEQTEARVRLEGIVETVRHELDCEPDAIREAPCPELAAATSPSSRRSELERELRLMGPINPLALEEHTALQERHAFLESQLEDVRSGRRELTKVVRAVDAEIIEVFGAAYADVADSFEKLFATLFPGGEGRLRLTEPDRLLETGIEIEARPSGKNLRRLSLLSGGERSLAALAFLFAVFRARPSPFYMLDEVEAALDDVNLHRFLDLIHEFRQEAQLLIVSHQKRTMEAADCLYGVTMAPGGSSRVISERVAAPVR